MIISKGTFSELIARGVIHWVMMMEVVKFVVVHPHLEIIEPFFTLGSGSRDDSAFAPDAIREDLHSIYDYSGWFIFFRKNVRASEIVERELIVWRILLEVIFSKRSGCGF